MDGLGRGLMLLGAVLIVLGALLHLGAGSALHWLGRLPGDLRLERPGLSFYFPLTSCLLLSAVLSALMYLWSKLH